MDDILLQIILPFFLSAVIVILVTLLAERYGTKVGGILGTLPHLIIIAFIFISVNKGEDFAARSAVIVPVEVGINILFLFLFAHYSVRSLHHALFVSLGVWTVLSGTLVLLEPDNIYLSLLSFGICWIGAFIMFERVKGTVSSGKVTVHYTFRKILARGIMAGMVIAFAVVMSNVGSVMSGIFAVFPAMFLSTMVISLREHGPDFVNALAKSMIFGTPSVTSYAVFVHFLYPMYGMPAGTVISTTLSVTIGMMIFSVRNRIQ